MAILDDFRLDGKLAVVTGSSQGIGQGMAKALAEAGVSREVIAQNLAEVAKNRTPLLAARLQQLNVDQAEIVLEFGLPSPDRTELLPAHYPSKDPEEDVASLAHAFVRGANHPFPPRRPPLEHLNISHSRN